MTHNNPSRRQFGIAVGGAIAASSLGANVSLAGESEAKKNISLGFDNFSLRALNWKADRLLAFAGEQKLDSILFSDLDVFKNHTPAYLKSLANKADDLGLKIQSGTGSICQSAARFDDKWGSAQEHLKLAIQVAKDVGSNVVRCYLGGMKDRLGDGGIRRYINETVVTLKAVKTMAIDANVKIGVENHAGDMQAWELVELIEAAGSDFVGATLDSGNATWTLEHPQDNLEVLAPFAVSSGIRDSTIWQVDDGVKVAWNAIGEGQVDWKRYAETWAKLCPNVPFQLEIISGFGKPFPYQKKEFWKAYQDAKARDFEAFMKLARAGQPVAAGKPNDPEFQMAELKRSISFCKNELGLGLK